MEFQEAADFLFDLRRFRPRPGTESTAAFLSFLDDPHHAVDCIQIAGSNGKGSTARMLESILLEAGYSVGLYTSPHLEDVRERIRVDGRKIPRSACTTFVETTQEYIANEATDGTPPTFFETMTTLALWHFGREEVDIAILEVGIGGKYDATSVVDPIASAVTSVSLEHTAILGETVEEIARDKAHVYPSDGPLVTATSDEALQAIETVAPEVLTVGHSSDCDVVVEYKGLSNHTEAEVSLDASGWSVEARIPLLGTHQAENAGIAACLARTTGEVSLEAVTRGLRSAHWPGRFEVMQAEPLVVLDGAHNPDACARIAETLTSCSYENLHLVFGSMHEKDHRSMVEQLPAPDSAIVTRPTISRAADLEVLARVFERESIEDVRTIPSVDDAVTAAIDRADPNDCVLVTGSLFTVAEARSRYTRSIRRKQPRTKAGVRSTLESANVPRQEIDRLESRALHRILATRVTPSQASTLKQELLDIGGECALSGIQREDSVTDILMIATLDQFDRLLDRLNETSGVTSIRAAIKSTLETERPTIDVSSYPWERSPAIMGILNVTPDSFHDGGRFVDVDDAIDRARSMADAGADIIDIGGESTRPGADPVATNEELERILPVIDGLSEVDAAISVDTRKAVVAEAAIDAGADIINDVSGLADPAMRFVIAEHDVPVILMHSIDAPVDPEKSIQYDDVIEDVIDELTERVILAEKAGIDRSKIVIDPGIGFGKSPEENFAILDRLSEFHALGCPVLVGHSHKSMFEHIGYSQDDRLVPTVAATALAVDRGADVIRVHDVSENVSALETALSLRDAGGR